MSWKGDMGDEWSKTALLQVGKITSQNTPSNAGANEEKVTYKNSLSLRSVKKVMNGTKQLHFTQNHVKLKRMGQSLEEGRNTESKEDNEPEEKEINKLPTRVQ